MNYYVYYRIEPSRLRELWPLVQQLFLEIEQQTGIRGRWMRRRDDPTTYMEVFEGVKDEGEFEKLLASASARLGVQRKVERFISAEIPV